jgi:stearoyl-CoA desaturase (delta-9 desaturase)
MPYSTNSEPRSPRGLQWDYIAIIQFIFFHLGCLFVFWTGVSWVAISACLFFYCLRIFAIGGGYHRYFAHRSFKTSRAFQFVLAFLGTLAYQKGPLWWTAIHRYHHLHADTEDDIHSPVRDGFWYSHFGWIFSLSNRETNEKMVPNLKQYSELRFLDKFYALPPLILAASMYLLGVLLHRFTPDLHTSGVQMLVWGFFISTVLVHHAVYSVNSIAHMFGSRRFDTPDKSRNNIIVALLTFGEGWHNNHHHYQRSARQGFYWWEIDITHYVLKVLSYLGIIWDLQSPPERVYAVASFEKAVGKALPVYYRTASGSDRPQHSTHSSSSGNGSP